MGDLLGFRSHLEDLYGKAALEFIESVRPMADLGLLIGSLAATTTLGFSTEL